MRTLRTAAIAAIVAVALVVAGGILGRRPPAPTGSGTVAVAAPADLLTQRIDRVRERLDRVPGDWPAWADLGLAYVDLSRVTASSAFG